MIISIIAAMDRNRLIGNNNQLPWHLPVDFAHFKTLTMGKPIVMGRKTFESIGKPLPGRQNIVLTRDASWQANGVDVADGLERAFELAQAAEEVMIIGGSSVYQLAMPKIQRMYLTHVEAEFEGDAWFPELALAQWNISADHCSEIDDRNRYRCRFVTYEKKSAGD